MRHLILLRGAPGVGKSTFVEHQGLKQFTISPDEFRMFLVCLREGKFQN